MGQHESYDHIHAVFNTKSANFVYIRSVTFVTQLSGLWLDVDVVERLRHSLQWAAAAINAECHRNVFVPCYSLDERVLNPGIPKVVNERVAEAMECLSRVGDALLGFVATEPLRWCVAQLPPHGFQFREQTIFSSTPD